MSEVNKSDWDTASNPVLAYADSYRQMARTGTTEIGVWSIITDIERNIAPLMADALSQLAALREELLESDAVVTKLSQLLAGVAIALRGPELESHRHGYNGLPELIADLQQRLADAERRDAVMSKLLQRCVPVCRYKGSHTERQLIDEIDAALNKPEEAKS